ncbi:MAG: hypothetical protein ABSC72_11430 [Methylovirgula sp.]|jgi:hypothetical protein
MKAGRIALVSLAGVLGLAAPWSSMQAGDLARPSFAPFASATLYFDSTTGGVSILSQNNVALAIRPAQYQDMDMSRAFYVECRLAANDGLRSIGVWVGTPAHTIPADVVDYHTFDPAYLELDIDTAYFENRSDNLLFKNHEIHIEFFEKP